jgi:hypothetical protein
MLRRSGIACWLLATLAAAAVALQDSKDANKLLQQSLKDTEIHVSWIYNDVAAGFAEAKRTGKALLVVFR